MLKIEEIQDGLRQADVAGRAFVQYVLSADYGSF